MNEQEIKQVKAKTQRLETLLSDLQKDVELLNKSGVDVSSEAEIANRQTEIQEECEQVVSDLLLLLDESGEISTEENTVTLPNPQRNPVSDGDLPAPSGGRADDRGNPEWTKRKSNNGNSN